MKSIKYPYNDNVCDIVLAIDCSGSMSTDGKKYITTEVFNEYLGIWQPVREETCDRIIAAKGFINSIDDNDRVAIVKYSDTAELLRGLTPKKDKGLLHLALSVDNINANGGNNFNAPIAMAKELIGNNDGSEKILILMTDGKPENYPLDEALLAEARSAGITIYTVGFGTECDDSMLETIAGKSGKYYKVDTADKLVEAYSYISSDNYIDDTDDDLDGIPDVYEICGMIVQTLFRSVFLLVV